MSWRHLIIVTGLASWSAQAAADDATIGDFAGTWQGTELTTSGDTAGLTLEPADLNVAIESDGAGFRMRWTGLTQPEGGELERQKIDASFTPTERPGVYAFAPDGTSLLSRLFADPETGNPLEGQALLWARLVGATLIVYRLAIDYHGGLELDRYARTLSEGGLDVRYTRRVQNDQILTVDGRATAGGG